MSVLDDFAFDDLADDGPRPTKYSQYVGILAVAAAIVAVTQAVTVSLAVVVTGGVVLAVGGLHGDRTWLTRGYVVMVVGALLHGALGGWSVATVGSVIAATIAWDVMENGIGLAEQLGTEASAKRAVLVHAVAVTLVGSLAGGAAILVTFVFANNQPLPALVLLLFATVLVTASVRQG